jgi:4-hydroxybutyryl-CoA dehydratase/vinylacetyl-CoA-Delta-isomerase
MTTETEGEIDQGNARYGVVGGECLTILEDVFVPWGKRLYGGEYPSPECW